MRKLAPTVLDVTHSLQQPNQASGVTGGRPDMIETIARAAVVNNIDGLFIQKGVDIYIYINITILFLFFSFTFSFFLFI